MSQDSSTLLIFGSIIAFFVGLVFLSFYFYDRETEKRKVIIEKWRQKDLEFKKKQENMKVNGIDPSGFLTKIICWKNGKVTYVTFVPQGIDYEFLNPNEFKEKYPDFEL